MTHKSPCRVLLDDDRYIVAQTLPFGMASWRWGAVHVVTKATGQMVRANAAERAFLRAVVRELEQQSAHFPGPMHECLFRQFAESVSLRQTAFFKRENARTLALNLSRGGVLPG